MFPSPTLSLPSLLILTSAMQAYILHLSHTAFFILAEKEFKKTFHLFYSQTYLVTLLKWVLIFWHVCVTCSQKKCNRTQIFPRFFGKRPRSFFTATSSWKPTISSCWCKRTSCKCKVLPFVVAILFVFIVPNSEEVYSLRFSIMTKFLDAIENLVIKIPEIINNAAHLKLITALSSFLRIRGCHKHFSPSPCLEKWISGTSSSSWSSSLLEYGGWVELSVLPKKVAAHYCWKEVRKLAANWNDICSTVSEKRK